MKKFSITLFLICILSLSVQAELPAFDFSEYTPPDYALQSLRLDVNPLVSYDYSKSTSDLSEDRTAKRFYSNINGDYRIHLKRDKWDLSAQITDSFFYSNIDQNTDSATEYSKYLTLTQTAWGEINYFVAGDFFLHGNSGIIYSHVHVQGDGDVDYHFHDSEIKVTGGIGYGRVRNVDFMRRALYIIDELYENDILVRYPEKKSLIEFGQLLVSLNRTRFYDSRIHRIETFEAIDSFLSGKNLIAQDNVKYFAIVNDMLNYAPTWDRENGWKTGVDLGREHYHNNINGSDNATTITKNNIIIYADFYRAINRYWQANLILTYMDRNNTFDKSAERVVNNYSYMANFQLGWYPNSRTRILGTLQANAYSFDSSQDDLLTDDDLLVEYFAGITGNYYISPRFRISGITSYNYTSENDKITDDKSKMHSTRFTLQLSYDFF